MINSLAKWIWREGDPQKNEFVYFEDTFNYKGGKLTLSICAETDYIAYVNGKEVAFGQYAGYPDLKFFDETDITEYAERGENKLSLTVRYEGVNTATHIDDGAGVIFSVESEDSCLVFSSESTLSALDERYVSGSVRQVTRQLGLSVDMKCGTHGALNRSVIQDKTKNIRKRPIKKCVIGDAVKAHPLRNGLYDLGREYAGYLYFKYKSCKSGEIRVAYGEHITDGGVRYIIRDRNFSFTFGINEGEGEICQKFVRIAARYLEVFLPLGCELVEIGILPNLYPLTEKGHSLCGRDADIYETSVRTLRLCMNMHYEDCPWREQALYVMDSRNQMLAGYYAFHETEFARACLALMSHGVRDDGLLELTFPAKNTPAIPFFSLMYPVAVFEYTEHTGDVSLLDEVWDSIKGIMNTFVSRLDGTGLVKEFTKPLWNFYEWTDGSSGKDEPSYSLILNSAFLYSLARYEKLCKIKEEAFFVNTDAIKDAIVREFFDKESGLFCLSDTKKNTFSELGQAFAMLSGLGDERTVDALKSGKLIPASLSMACFVYDALLDADKNNADYVLSDIRKKYSALLDRGLTSFPETLECEEGFEKAGSLCHGWSAMPAYYYKTLLEKER